MQACKVKLAQAKKSRAELRTHLQSLPSDAEMRENDAEELPEVSELFGADSPPDSKRAKIA